MGRRSGRRSPASARRARYDRSWSRTKPPRSPRVPAGSSTEHPNGATGISRFMNAARNTSEARKPLAALADNKESPGNALCVSRQGIAVVTSDEPRGWLLTGRESVGTGGLLRLGDPKESITRCCCFLRLLCGQGLLVGAVVGEGEPSSAPPAREGSEPLFSPILFVAQEDQLLLAPLALQNHAPRTLNRVVLHFRYPPPEIELPRVGHKALRELTPVQAPRESIRGPIRGLSNTQADVLQGEPFSTYYRV